MSKKIPEHWHPMRRAIDIAHIGKMLEELGEAVSAGARSIIQGIEGLEPDTKKPNRQWLTEELADVSALIKLNIEHFELDQLAIDLRAQRKTKHKQLWFKMLLDDEWNASGGAPHHDWQGGGAT